MFPPLLLRTDVRSLRRPSPYARGSRYWTYCEFMASTLFIVSGRRKERNPLRSQFVTARIGDALEMTKVFDLVDLDLHLLSWSSGAPLFARVVQVLGQTADGLVTLELDNGETYFLRSTPTENELLDGRIYYSKLDEASDGSGT